MQNRLKLWVWILIFTFSVEIVRKHVILMTAYMYQICVL